MSDKKKMQLMAIFFMLWWGMLTVIIGGIMVGLNLILPIFSTLRLILGISVLCFAMSVLFVVCNYKRILDSFEATVEKKE